MSGCGNEPVRHLVESGRLSFSFNSLISHCLRALLPFKIMQCVCDACVSFVKGQVVQGVDR